MSNQIKQIDGLIDKIISNTTVCFDKEEISNLLSSPKVAPNNLEIIKRFFNFTNKTLSAKLDVVSPYIGSVASGKANFSGYVFINMLQELNIDSNLYFDINDTVTIESNVTSHIILVISTKEDLEKLVAIHGINILNKIISVILRKDTKYDIDDKGIEYAIKAFYGLKRSKERFNINSKKNLAKNCYREIAAERIEKYNDILSSFNNESLKANDLYVIGIEKREVKEMTYEINTFSNYDSKTDKLLNTIPFRKIIAKSLPKTEFINMPGDKVKLNKKYDILTSEGLKNTDVLKKEQYKILNNGGIAFSMVSDEPIWNKLKAFRLLTKHSDIYIADVLGVSPATLRLLETGYNKISLRQIWIIRYRLGIFFESLFDKQLYLEKFSED